jgi:hypothetical protein
LLIFWTIIFPILLPSLAGSIETAETRLASAVFDISMGLLFAWYDEDHGKIYQDAGHTTGDQGDEKGEAEPEGAHPEKFSQSAAHPGDHAIAAGTS